MSHAFEEFRARREAGNQSLLDTNSLVIKRLVGLDKNAYADGALDARTKELLGLVASMVLRCNDCIDYHLMSCLEAGYSRDELDESMAVAMLVGGSIVIPHARHASRSLDFLIAESEQS
jgi:AhpD family alkylhydroperoxidase